MPGRRSRAMPKPSGPTALVARWRAEAEVLRRRGAESLATCLVGCADELAEWAKQHALEALTLEQAAAESGYSYSALQHRLADGSLKNAGTQHRPRIRRADLPRKVQTKTGQGLVQFSSAS